jgi:tetratricopeptide (TPR) repeat protein
MVTVLAAIAFVQVGFWRDSDSLWRQALRVNDRSGLANVNLGVSLLNSGDLPEAIRLLRKAAEIDANDPFAHLNLTRALLMSGDTAGAASSALKLAAAYARRADFDPALTADVLDRFARDMERRGDHPSAARLRDEAARLRAAR